MSSPVTSRITRLGRRRSADVGMAPASADAVAEMEAGASGFPVRRVATIIAISLIASAIASGAVTVLVRQARARRANLPPANAPHATW